MTYVTGNSSHIFFWHRAKNLLFPRWPPKNLLGTITDEPLVGLLLNMYGCSLGIYDDLITFCDEFIKNKEATAALLKN